MADNPTLRMVYSLTICKGVFNSQISTINEEEKALWTFFIVNIRAPPSLESMNVEEKGLFRL